MTDQTAAADLSTLLDVPGMARAKRENEQLRNALVRASAALERVTAELAEAYCLAAEEFAAACAAQQRVWRAASDLAREHAERTTR